MSKKISIEIIDSQDSVIFDLDYVKNKVYPAYDLFVLRNQVCGAPLVNLDSIEISILDDRNISKVHFDFMNDPSPTDVITFDYGEILVSAETAKIKSEELEVSTENEVLLYIIHGMLHLAGYSDRLDNEFKEMKSLQEMILDSCTKL